MEGNIGIVIQWLASESHIQSLYSTFVPKVGGVLPVLVEINSRRYCV